MLPECFTDKIQGNVRKPSFWKFPSQGQYWKSESMYVPGGAIQKYGLKFGPNNSPMSFLLPEGKVDGFTKIYDRPCFSGWTGICRNYNLKPGYSVVCELELAGGVVAAIRLHFPK